MFLSSREKSAPQHREREASQEALLGFLQEGAIEVEGWEVLLSPQVLGFLQVYLYLSWYLFTSAPVAHTLRCCSLSKTLDSYSHAHR